VTDWTVIVTSLGAAGIAGSFGYLSARQSGKVALRQAETENERLRTQHREDHLRNRQGTYHSFLTAEARLDATFRLSARGATAPEQAQTVFLDLVHLMNGVVLFGSTEAASAARKLEREWAALTEEARTKDPSDPHSLVNLRETLFSHDAALSDAREALIAAMRADVGPRDDE
jgi:hypothetical protein